MTLLCPKVSSLFHFPSLGPSSDSSQPCFPEDCLEEAANWPQGLSVLICNFTIHPPSPAQHRSATCHTLARISQCEEGTDFPSCGRQGPS